MAGTRCYSSFLMTGVPRTVGSEPSGSDSRMSTSSPGSTDPSSASVNVNIPVAEAPPAHVDLLPHAEMGFGSQFADWNQGVPTTGGGTSQTDPLRGDLESNAGLTAHAEEDHENEEEEMRDDDDVDDDDDDDDDDNDNEDRDAMDAPTDDDDDDDDDDNVSEEELALGSCAAVKAGKRAAKIRSRGDSGVGVSPGTPTDRDSDGLDAISVAPENGSIPDVTMTG